LSARSRPSQPAEAEGRGSGEASRKYLSATQNVIDHVSGCTTKGPLLPENGALGRSNQLTSEISPGSVGHKFLVMQKTTDTGSNGGVCTVVFTVEVPGEI
jgi:hypothetical protein